MIRIIVLFSLTVGQLFWGGSKRHKLTCRDPLDDVHPPLHHPPHLSRPPILHLHLRHSRTPPSVSPQPQCSPTLPGIHLHTAVRPTVNITF